MDDLHPRQRDRLLNSVLFLAARTSYCGTAKLYRLLYLFDVHHFRLTGVTATGEDYLAYEFGPLPIHLDEGLNRDWWKFELRGILAPTRDPSIDFSQIAWSAPVDAFNDDSFSPQQLQFLQSLVNRYHAAHFLDVDLSEDHGAWESTWFHGRGKGARIPFELTLPVNDPMTPEILELQKQEQSRLAAHRELMRAGGHAA